MRSGSTWNAGFFKRDSGLRSEPLLVKPLQMLADDEVFEKRGVSLGWHHVDHTSNHVERKNRSF